ncbi:MAG: type II toxin-antitoxin system YafQ family toxin [Candidatus Cloacimonetes bacterium]|nr:type II toxin-antitoxin system YafQ family toxin [Candidatus Cloacimonadota bacterium]
MATAVQQGLRFQSRPLLPEQVREWRGRQDCHIEPDWILIYRITENELHLERTGTHSDLF